LSFALAAAASIVTNGKSTTRRHFVEVKASEDGSNRDAIGGWVEVRVGDGIQRRVDGHAFYLLKKG
jgi:hypothetical protein